ncbi:MAG: glycosyltransferase [Ilumatobacteraceae bacterium]
MVLDIHHEPFEEPRWSWTLGPTVALARRSALAVVTNQAHADLLRARGVTSTVLHDPPHDADGRRVRMGADGHVIVPACYGPDEPIAEVLLAAASMPETSFKITGRVPARFDRCVPPNVELTGYVPAEEYISMLDAAAVVCCLTDKENTMQRGGYEALAYHRPLVTSGTAVLREYYEDAAKYCEPHDPASIAAALREALAESTVLAPRMAALHDRRVAEYEDRLAPLREALGQRT